MITIRQFCGPILLKISKPKKLTFVDDLPEEVLAPKKVPSGAVPSLVAELVLALVNGVVGPLGHGHQKARVFPGESALLSAQGAVHRGVHVEHPRRYGGEVVWLAGFRYPPATKHDDGQGLEELLRRGSIKIK